MKKFPLTIVITFFICALIALAVSCDRELKQDTPPEEIPTARVATKNCTYPVCDVTKNPDLQLVTNAEEVRPLLPDGQVDSFSYFFTKYHVRTNPIYLEQNHVVTAYEASYYPGWKAGDTITIAKLECLVENIAPKDCGNDWLYNESQGYLVGTNLYFDGLFEFETSEKGNGNNWKLLYTDYKKQFFPDAIPTVPYIYNTDFCYYYGIGERAIQAQMGDFYNNKFRLPNHDGVYKLVLKFNPLEKGCRAVKETNYNNNEKTIVLEITEGQVIIR